MSRQILTNKSQNNCEGLKSLGRSWEGGYREVAPLTPFLAENCGYANLNNFRANFSKLIAKYL